MQKLTVTIDVDCANDQEHLATSNMLKTILTVLDMSVEARHAGNNFKFKIEGDHPSSVANIPSKDAIDHAMGIGNLPKVK